MSLKIREIERPGEREEKKKAKKDLRQNMSRRERKVSHAVVTVFRFVAAIVCCQLTSQVADEEDVIIFNLTQLK